MTTDLVLGLCFVMPSLVIGFGPRAYSVMMVVLLVAYSVAFWGSPRQSPPGAACGTGENDPAGGFDPIVRSDRRAPGGFRWSARERHR